MIFRKLEIGAALTYSYHPLLTYEARWAERSEARRASFFRIPAQIEELGPLAWGIESPYSQLLTCQSSARSDTIRERYAKIDFFSTFLMQNEHFIQWKNGILWSD